MSNNIYLLDGHGLIFRSYFAHIRNPLHNTRGENTSAIFGFFQAIQKIYTTYAPHSFVVALDSVGDTFRSELYSEYKANRQKTPEDLTNQIPIIVEILNTLQIPNIAVPRMEADDIIASIVAQASQKNISTTIISSDKDLFQLLDNSVRILRPTIKSTDWEEIDTQWLEQEWKITPTQVVDYLAIIGDSSDNVPGVAGIGPKSAVPLLQEYHTLQSIYDNIDSIKENWRKKLQDSKDNAFLSKELVTLNNEISIPSLDTFECPTIVWERAHDIFASHDIFTFSKKKTAPTNTRSNVPRLQYHIIQQEQELDELLKKVKAHRYIAIEVLANSDDTITATPMGISISLTPQEGYYIPLHSTESNTLLDNAIVLPAIQTIFDTAITIVMHNSKAHIAVLSNWGISFTSLYKRIEDTQSTTVPQVFDTTIAAWMCIPDAFSYSLDDLAQQLLAQEPQDFNKEIDSTDPNTMTLNQLAHYTAYTTSTSLQLYNELLTQLQSKSLDTLFFSLEIPLLLLLVQIETHGICVDTQQMNMLSEKLSNTITSLQKEIFTICGEEFNINSPKQLQEILFTKLALPTGKKTKTGYSTDNSVLDYLSTLHPVPEKIVEFRHLSKLKSTYTDSLPTQINPHTKRIHTTLAQTGTETGRISSINPNLQNIPIKDAWGKKIRSAFIAPENHVLIGADYSQIELKVLAHVSQDSNMIEAFKKGVDIHSRTASIIFSTDEANVSEEQRRIAKTINFAIIYGMSAFQLSNDLKISQHEAKMFIEAYFTEFSGITNFIANTIANTENTMSTRTILGHIRPIHNINSKNKILKKAAERVAVNTIIQGSAADIMKVAMIKVHNALLSHSLQSRIILQIHDELLIECPKHEEEQVLALVPTVMEQAYQLSIPLQVSIASGLHWGVLK